ncbi:MAG: hypothetical protein WEG36_02065 [Gemmatimonadota bacterium]
MSQTCRRAFLTTLFAGAVFGPAGALSGQVTEPDSGADRLAWMAGALQNVLQNRDYPAVLVVAALNRMAESGDESALAAAAPLISALSSPSVPSARLRSCRSDRDPVEGTLCALETLLPLTSPLLGKELTEEGARFVSSFLRPGEVAPAGDVTASMGPFQRYAEEVLGAAWTLAGSERTDPAGTGSFANAIEGVFGFSPGTEASQVLSRVPELREFLAHYPTISQLADGARSPQGVLREYQSFLTSLTSSIGVALAGVPSAQRTGDPSGSTLGWATQRVFSFLAAESATYAGLDAAAAERIRTIGGAAADLQLGASSFASTLVSAGRDAALAALGGNVLGVAASVTAFFGGTGRGFGPNAAVELRSLREGIAAMHTEVDARLDGVDARFDEVFSTLDGRFVTLERLVASNSTNLRSDFAEIHAAVVSLSRRMDRLEENVQSYMQAGFDREYNRTLVRCLEHRERYLPPLDEMDFGVFSECLADFRSRASLDARDALLTDRTTPLDNGSLAEAFADPSLENLARRLPLLGRVAELRYGYPAVIRGKALANPIEWAVAAQAYLRMLQDWPGHARAVAPGDLEAILAVGAELQEALESLSVDPTTGVGGDLLARVLREYEGYVRALTSEADILAQRHRQAQLRRIPLTEILTRIDPPAPGAPSLPIPPRLSQAVPQAVWTAAILNLGEASFVYRLSLEDAVVRENFRRRFLIFGKRHDRVTSTRVHVDVELRFSGRGTIARYALTGPWVVRLREEMSGGETSEDVVSASMLISDPGSHFVTQIWPELSREEDAWEVPMPSPAPLEDLKLAIEAELRRHGSVAAASVFSAACAGNVVDPAMSASDRGSVSRIEVALDGLTLTRSLFGAYARLALPQSVALDGDLAAALDGDEALLDRPRLCHAFAAGENPLRLVWLEEEPQRRVEHLSGLLNSILTVENAVPKPLLVMGATLRQVEAATRIQRLRTIAARVAR